MQTDSSSSTEAVVDAPAVINSADVPKSAEVSVSPEKLVNDLTEIREQIATVLDKTDAALEAAKAQGPVVAGQVVAVEKPAPIVVPADQMPPGSEAQAALDSAMLGAAAKAVTGAPAAEVVAAETVVTEPVAETPVATPEAPIL